MEPLYKGHIGTLVIIGNSTVEPLYKGTQGHRDLGYIGNSTVEPLYKGHIGTLVI